MKILHTSDWHLGQVFHDYDRSEEQRDMLRQITDIVTTEQPDALVVSGDVFHTGSPSSTALEMYNEAILGMHEACPQMQIVVTAGNHDSAARLVVNNSLWEHFNVSVIGHVAKHKDENRTPDYEPHVIKVCDNNKNVLGYIAAIPHCYESNFPTENPELQRKERMTAYFEELNEYVKSVNTEGLPTVLMAHMAVTGCDFAGHDMIGGMECKDADVLGSGYDYVALGHIHTPQNINERVRYCGTPIPVNFGEKFEHSVSIVTLEKGEKPVVETKAIKNLIPLHDFPTQLPDADVKEEELDEKHRPLPFNEVLDKLREFDPDKRCYLRLIVKVDDTLSPLANAQIAEVVKGKKCRYCLIKPFIYKKDKDEAEAKRQVKLDVGSLKEKSPLDIAQMFFAMKGLELTDTKAEMIRISTEKAEQNTKEDNNNEA